jgi:hypothetical protein
MVSPFLCTLALFCLISCGPLNSGPLGKAYPKLSKYCNNWLIFYAHTAQPINLAGKWQHEEQLIQSARYKIFFFTIVHNFKLSVPIVQLVGPQGV